MDLGFFVGARPREYARLPMRSTLGLLPEIAVAEPLTLGEIAAFERVLHGTLGARNDRERNLAAYAAGVAAAPAGALRPGGIAEACGGRASAKRLRHVIEHAPVDERLLRRRLVGAAPFAAVVAFSLEQHSLVHGDGSTGTDIFSLHAVGRDWIIPIGWCAEPIPPPDTDAQTLGIDDVEARAVSRLLTQMAADYDAVEPTASLSGTGPPPVLLQAESFGENRDLRLSLRCTVGEYVARVSGSYADLRLRSDPLERVEPGRQLQDHFAPIPPGADPPPRELLDGSPDRRGREYVVALQDAERVEYVIVRPLPIIAPGALLGERAEHRARELGQLALEIGDSDAARRLRLTDLRGCAADLLRRHALLVSMLAVFRAGRLAEAPA